MKRLAANWYSGSGRLRGTPFGNGNRHGWSKPMLSILFALIAQGTAQPVGSATQASAQPVQVERTDIPQTDPASEIVVTGHRERTKAVSSLMRQISPRAPEHPLARFAQPPCISIMGFRREFGLMMASRLMSDVQRVKLPPSSSSCRPNMWIAAVPPTDFAAIRHKSGISPRSKDPVIVVHDLATHSGDGDAIHKVGSPGSYVPTLTLSRASRIANPIRIDMEGAVLIFPSPLVDGKTPTQLADYGIMRLMAELDDPINTDVPTILTLFVPDKPVAPALTQFDEAYLDGLYSGTRTERWGATFGRIRRALTTGGDAHPQGAAPAN